MPPPLPQQPCRRGLVALGDSITAAEGQSMLGLPHRSWAQWLAQALGLPFTNLAVNGAVSADVRDHQLGRLRGPYELACLYVGVNDVRDPRFDAPRLAATLAELVAPLSRRADHVLLVTLPLDLGRPRAGAKVTAANELIRAVADRHGAAVVHNERQRGFHEVLPDAVHLTALGQLRLAQRASATLSAQGMTLDCPLTGLIDDQPGARALLHYTATGHTAALVRDLRRRRRERSLLATLRPWSRLR